MLRKGKDKINKGGGMMAKIEEILNNWKWDEEKIAEYLEKFKEYLSSSEGKKELEIGNEKKLKLQKFLEDEESIDKLSTEELKELLRMVNTIRTYEDKIKPKERPITSEIDKGNIEYINQIKDWLKKLITIKEGDSLPKSPKYCSAKAASELLTFRYPEKFYIVNGACIKGLNELRLDNIPELNESDVNESNYPNWRPLFEYLKDKISKVIKDKLDKETDYYDVDLFLYFISEQNKKSKKKKTDESQDKNKESFNIAETGKESDTKNELTLHKFFQYKRFHFDQDLITAFYSALKTKGFVILSGLTGTGKTKLAQLFAELLCPNCNPQDKQDMQITQASSENQNQSKCTHLFLSVRPDWRDTKDLLGYYNPINKTYESTSLLKFILEAKKNCEDNKHNASPYFIILDEMNLSHVEYYFADFLSVLESGRDQKYWTKETIKLHNIDKKESIDKKEDIGKNEETILIPKEIKLPPNLYIIGSVNIDETTYMFSPKVLDRAFTIEFRDVNFEKYLEDLKKGNDISKDKLEKLRNALLEDFRNGGKFCTAIADKDEVKSAINKLSEPIKVKLINLNQVLQPYDLHFGYRVLDEIALFIKYATNAPKEVGELSVEQALDFAVLMKVLPKFHGPRQKLERPLWLVLKWCARNSEEFENVKPEVIKNLLEELLKEKEKRSEKFKYPRTALKVLRMLRQLYETGFTSFA
jgi:5-methylcytosine-specific restriction endonuclease McrBC GTP-binding regulatory subunit McrB